MLCPDCLVYHAQPLGQTAKYGIKYQCGRCDKVFYGDWAHDVQPRDGIDIPVINVSSELARLRHIDTLIEKLKETSASGLDSYETIVMRIRKILKKV